MTVLAEEAVEWLMRLAEDDSPACRNAFHAWFSQSPRHVQEFLQATEISHALRGMDAERHIDIKALLRNVAANVVTLDDGGSRKSIARKPFVRRYLPFAAALATVLVMAGTYFIGTQPNRPQFTTAIGEQRTLKLADGSMLILNTRSHVQLKFNDQAREVRLIDGEALFTVARDPARPFRVITSDAIIQALGTQFDVHRGPHGTKVAVIEGSVRVSAPHASTTKLSAGEGAQVSVRGKLVTRSLPNPIAALAWRERRLEFHDAALEDVAAEFNRYNAVQIRLEGAIEADKRITGIFNADNPEALIRFLEKDRSIRVSREADGITLRQP